jgi:hypothetical protein
VGEAKLFLELGMGTGKLALQVFVQVPSIERVVGVELAPSRYQMGAAALKRMVELPSTTYKLKESSGSVCIVEEDETGRILEFRCGDMFAIHDDIAKADAIIMEVSFGEDLVLPTCQLMQELKDGCRLIIFYRLEEIWSAEEDCPCHALIDTVSAWDWYATSWSPNHGHPFFSYVCDRSRPSRINAASARRQRLPGLSLFKRIDGWIGTHRSRRWRPDPTFSHDLQRQMNEVILRTSWPWRMMFGDRIHDRILRLLLGEDVPLPTPCPNTTEHGWSCRRRHRGYQEMQMAQTVLETVDPDCL